MTESSSWIDVAAVDALAAARQLVIEHGEDEALLMWNDGVPVALSNICIHNGRKLAEGVMLGTRIVCAGHQWAFEVTTGYCAARERYQPRYEVDVRDGRVHLELPAKTGADT